MAKKKENKEASTEAEMVVVPAKQTDVEKDELKGPVKQCRETFHKAMRRNGVTVAGVMTHGGDDDHTNKLVSYDEKGMRMEFVGFQPDGAYNISPYNESGQNLKRIMYNKDGSEYLISWNIYDKHGFICENGWNNADGTLGYRTTSIYDEQGRPKESKQFGASGKMNGYTIYTYYDNGTHLYDSTHFNEEGIKQYRHTWLYDEKSNMLEEHEYDTHDNLTETKVYNYKMNHLGKMVSTDPSAELYQQYHWRNVFEDDSHGNWIRKIVYYKKAAMNIVVRDITYYDDDSKDIFLDYKDTLAMIIKPPKEDAAVPATIATNPMAEMNEEQLKWMTEGSASEMFPLLRYYVLKNKEFPSTYSYAGMDCESFFLKRELMEKLEGRIINTFVMDRENSMHPSMIRYTLSFLEGKYLLNAFQIQERNEDDFYVPDAMYGLDERRYSELHTSQLSMFHPSNESGKRDYGFEDELFSLIDMCKLVERPSKPEIYMVQVSGNGAYSLVGHAVDDTFEIKDLNLNYGQGFEDFHDELMDRFENENKGLILFHGEPGTGKTYYIRHLLRSMANKNKIVIYMPPNMVDYMVEPQFMSFISNEVQQFSQENNFCVLLIEDAEPILASRSSDTRIQGVSNLLNMTDGLLNDMLNIQIICTFNVKVSKLDKALLRPGRLLARKEFKALPEFESNLLASRLGIKHHFTSASTLAEIYAKAKSKNTLIHDVD